MTLGFHEYANLFPLIEGREFFELAADIREHGLLDGIELLGQEILDGRNRYRALVWLVSTGEPLGAGWGEGGGRFALDLAGKPLPAALLAPDSSLFHQFRPDVDGDPLAYVLSKNLNRRHLNDDQRRMVAARLVTMKQGRPAQEATPEKTSQIANISRDQAAQLLATDVAGLDRAKAVIAHGAPEMVAAVDDGRISVAAAAEIAAQPAERQAQILAELPRDEAGKLTPDVKKALGPVIAELRAEKVAAKREKRATREQTLGRRLQALPQKSFGVALEDFEWDHEPYSRETGMSRHPSMHYETAADAHTPAEIVARCAERFKCLADDCVIFKWATVPHLAIALEVLELQGFRYVTSMVWNKERAGRARGPGYWFTGEHELVLVGVRGKVVPPAFAHFRSNFSAPVGAHSEKPVNVHEIIEFHWPNTPKVEFNARTARVGWRAWGFDAPEASPLLAPADYDAAIVAQCVIELPALLDKKSRFAAAPSGGESVAAAADATSIRASAAAAVTDPPAFPPSEYADLRLFADRCRGDKAAALAPSYVARGLVHEWCGFWQLTPAGDIRLNVIERERAARKLLGERHLSADDFDLWQALAAIAGGEAIAGEIARGLVGEDLAACSTTRLYLTHAGAMRLAEFEAAVDAAAGVKLLAPTPRTPKQLDLEELLQGAR